MGLKQLKVIKFLGLTPTFVEGEKLVGEGGGAFSPIQNNNNRVQDLIFHSSTFIQHSYVSGEYHYQKPFKFAFKFAQDD